jgi:hypothetical protein
MVSATTETNQPVADRPETRGQFGAGRLGRPISDRPPGRVSVVRPLVVAALLTFPLTAPAQLPAGCEPQSRYYLILFGGQGNFLRPRTAHTWATYVRADPCPDGTVRLDPFTISWLPATLDVRPLKLHPEPGVNLTLEETFAFMANARHPWLQRIAMWGPFEIGPDRYWRAFQHKRRLESGAVTYRVLDWFDQHPDISHCIHAVTMADPSLHRTCQPVFGIGEFGTAGVARGLVRAGVVTQPDVTHDWLIPALGLDRYDLVRHRVGSPVQNRLTR